MSLKIAKSSFIVTDGKVDAIVYNQDIQELFDAFNGLEQQTRTLGGLTITPSVDSTSILKVTNAAGTALFQVSSTTGGTGGTGSAGVGKQYVELTIGGSRYRILHDGTI